MNEELWKLLEKAKHDAKLRCDLRATQKAEDPMLALCEMASELGFPVSVGEMYEDGEGYLADLVKGCRAKVEPNRVKGDEYGLFFAILDGMQR